MRLDTCLMVLLSSTCVATAFLSGWFWGVPWLRALSQRPIEHYLKRAGEVGFDGRRLRQQLFLVELLLLSALAWSTSVYLGLVLGGTLLAIGVHLRALVLSWLIEYRERVLRSQTLAFTSGLQGLVRGGLGLTQSIEAMVQGTPAPLGREISRIAGDYRRGRPLVESLQDVRSRIQLDAFSLMVTSICCALRQGASLESSLAGVQESLEHRDGVERQLRSKTANARATILFLSAMPFLFFALFWFMMPDSMPLIFATSNGKLMLAAIFGLMYVGIAWAKRLLMIR